MSKPNPAAKAAPAPKEIPVIETPAKPVIITEPPEPEPAPIPEPEKEEPKEVPTLTEQATDVLAKGLTKGIANPDKKVLFVSRHKELDVPVLAAGRSFRPIFDESKTLLIWFVDPDAAEYFSKHSLVVHGKIVRAL